MRLDEIVIGKADYLAVIDGIASAAGELIEALIETPNGKVDLTNSAPAGRTGRRWRKGASNGPAAAKRSDAGRPRRGAKAPRASRAKPAASAEDEARPRARGSKAPTDKMIAYAQNLARANKAKLPEGYQRDFDACRRFLDEHAR
ncbi:hypothetical protein C5688_17685 [Methylocystis sp. MitZ-2018]|nr:hypothetical protein C5688_17685 [Methylocystis sp. MitZ-2018]